MGQEKAFGGRRRKALVLTADKFEDLEVFFPVFRLLEEGWLVDIAAPKKQKIVGENGYEVMPRKTFDEVDPDGQEERQRPADRPLVLRQEQDRGLHLPRSLGAGVGRPGERASPDLFLA